VLERPRLESSSRDRKVRDRKVKSGKRRRGYSEALHQRPKQRVVDMDMQKTARQRISDGLRNDTTMMMGDHPQVLRRVGICA